MYGRFSLSKYLPHNHYRQFAFGHLYTVVSLQTLHYFSMNPKKWAPLQVCTTTLESSFHLPEDPIHLKQDTWVFKRVLQHACHSCFTAGYLTQPHAHTCIQLIRQGTFSERVLSVDLCWKTNKQTKKTSNAPKPKTKESLQEREQTARKTKTAVKEVLRRDILQQVAVMVAAK